ncbi:MAG TPA: hypothetical protein VJS11_15075 [Acidobacteriaceae bacterium]|nr:hypothetical protein [Acidobacteriaceae bacterium]
MATAELQPILENPSPKAGLLRNKWPERACLTGYIALLACMIPFHEPWADEAQAWMLARSLSLSQLFGTYLRYEGHPGLWYLLLWVLVRLRISYAGMHWFTGIIAACGMAVLVLCSPFPRWMRLSLPFTFFFAYQYAVVARSYVLVPLLLFSALAFWRRTPLIVALLLGLLANVAPHAAAISFGFAIVYCFDCASRTRGRLQTSTNAQLSAAALLLVSLYAFAAWTAFPPRDVFVAAFYHLPGQPVPSPATAAIIRFFRSMFWGMWFPYPLLGLVGWPVLITGIGRSGGKRLLIALLPFVVFCSMVYLEFWHAGLIIPLIIGILWLLWNEKGPSFRRGERLVYVTVGTLIASQIAGTAYAAVLEHSHEYFPGLKTARFLEPYVDSGGEIAVTYLRDAGVQIFPTVAIAPYFQNKLFMNQDTPFWWWSTRNRTEDQFPAALAKHPAAVVALYLDQLPFDPHRDLNGPIAALLAANGYHVAASFCGTMVTPLAMHPGPVPCDIVFTPEGRTAAPGRDGGGPSERLP